MLQFFESAWYSVLYCSIDKWERKKIRFVLLTKQSGTISVKFCVVVRTERDFTVTDTETKRENK